MGDYKPGDGYEGSGTFTTSQLDRVAVERTCEKCRVESIKVRTRYVPPFGPGTYRGRFCDDCWEGSKVKIYGRIHVEAEEHSDVVAEPFVLELWSEGGSALFRNEGELPNREEDAQAVRLALIARLEKVLRGLKGGHGE